ncbi:hypothetical protein SprV_0100398400 [Sparganum proliferum]
MSEQPYLGIAQLTPAKGERSRKVALNKDWEPRRLHSGRESQTQNTRSNQTRNHTHCLSPPPLPPPIATLAPSELCPPSETRPAGRAGDKGDPGCRRVDRPPLRHLQDEDSTTASQEISGPETSDALSRPSTISNADIARSSQVKTKNDLAFTPFLHETIKDVHQLSGEKAYGSGATPAEIYMRGGLQLMEHLMALLQEVWRQGEVPQDFKDTTIIHLHKRKGNHRICYNDRGISLLNTARKIFALILLNCLKNHLEQGLLPESRCGFRRHRGTIHMIFAARQLQEKCQEMRIRLYSAFVDRTKAIDTLICEGL